jgi:coniferyl-aldehyde dehydrogenase
MKAASERLTPVTLELGGKCPAILHESVPLERALLRVMKGKLCNAGQTCIAPDYLLAPAARVDDIVRIAAGVTARLYPALVGNPDYTRIINERHYDRLAGFIGDASAKRADITSVNPAAEACNSTNRVFAPAIVTKVRDDMLIASEEIFGPVLPVIEYKTIDEAIEFVNARPRPLALYYFDHDRKRIDQVLASTASGTAAVNDVVLQIAQNSLPFGGVGASGMGRYRGVHGFETFSNRRAVFEQSRLTVSDYTHPPYRRLKRAIEWVVRK